MPAQDNNHEGSTFQEKSKSTSSSGKTEDKLKYRYSSENLSDWNLYQLILMELFGEKKITYPLSDEEILKRKSPVPAPMFINFAGSKGQ